MKTKLALFALILVTLISACKDEDDDQSQNMPKDPDTAEKVSVDRFSDEAGTLFVRDGTNGLPGANAPIDFDVAPFITHGLSPDGNVATYYNFDVMSQEPAPIYVFFRQTSREMVEGQLNVIDVIPGDAGYNDFWHVHQVLVPEEYVANTVTSFQEIVDAGFDLSPTGALVNCPVVPEGSTADLRYTESESTGLTRGWYRSKVAYYFNFSEKALFVDMNDPEVPLSIIMVAFNINPGEPGGGPPSGFMTEPGTSQTHNVLETVPEDALYSPLWSVTVYDNADFDMVSDWASAQQANLLAAGVSKVNCPVVAIED